MRILKRNKQTVWFANRIGSEPVLDANGHRTGDKNQVYGPPEKTKMSWAESSGSVGLGTSGMATLELYGIVTNYTARAMTDDMHCTLDEESRVWHGIEPTRTVTVERIENGETVTEEQEEPVPHNYVVARRVPSFNHIVYYLREVGAP